MRSRRGWAFGSMVVHLSLSPVDPPAMSSENPPQDSPAQAPAPTKTKASSQPAGSKRAKRPKQQQQQAGVDGSSGGGGAAGQQKLKIVVRRLPPNIPEDIFWTSTEQWVNDETAGWRSFRKGKVAKSSVPLSPSTSRSALDARLTTTHSVLFEGRTRSRRTRGLTSSSRTRPLCSTFIGRTTVISSGTRPVRLSCQLFSNASDLTSLLSLPRRQRECRRRRVCRLPEGSRPARQARPEGQLHRQWFVAQASVQKPVRKN